MRFRFGLAVGFAAGYVLGTKAGHERYMQITETARKVWDSEQATKLREKAAETLPALSSAVEKVGEMRHRASINGELVGAGPLPA